jgi:hypothetical protein
MSRSLFVFLILANPSFACCTAWRAGEEAVQIAAQDVLVVRRASFESETAPEDFGFLVPTPTQPKLREVPDTVFHQLQEVIKPKVKIKKSTKFSLRPLSFSFLASLVKGGPMREGAMMKAGVEVLDTAFVGGFEATVLRASETGALLKWLEENGYDARPELHE